MSNEKFDLATEKFFYYCMGLRKGDIRGQVKMMQSRFPNDTPERLARRFIAAQTPLSMLSGALIHVPAVIPVAGPAIRFFGLASGTTLMMVLNMTLVMQIALIFGHDLDDKARIKELFAVIAATGLASSSTAVVPQLASLNPRLRAIVGGGTIMTTSQLMGEAALKYFRQKKITSGAPTSQADVSVA